MTEKYLYFAKNTDRSLAITSQSGQTYTLTTGLIDPVPTGRAASNDLFANGTLVVEYQNLHIASGTGEAAADDDHILGSHYIDQGLNVDDGKLTVDPNALLYDGTNAVTISTVAQDPIFGVTNSSTAGENDVTFTLKNPMAAGDACVWPATAFLGVHMVDNDTADIYFEPQTNDGVGGGVDKVRLSYAAGKFKELTQLMHDVCADSRNQGEMIVIADTFRGIFHGNNPAGITAVDSITLD